jgi:hypothetical protein
MPIASSVIGPPNMPFPMFFNTIPKKYHLPSGNEGENQSFYLVDFA